MPRILFLEDTLVDRMILMEVFEGQDLGEVFVPTSWKEGKVLLTGLRPGDVAVSDGYMGGDAWGESITARDTSAVCPEGVHFLVYTGNPDDFADLGRHVIEKPNPMRVVLYIRGLLAGPTTGS